LTMKNKNIAFVLLCVAMIAVIIAAVISSTGIKLELNLRKYHTFEAEDMEFSFYGGGGEVRRVKVKQNGQKLCDLTLEADAEAFKSVESAVVICEMNNDGRPDLLILTALDDDGDVHRALFLSASDGYQRAEGVDAVNHSVADGVIISEEKLVTYLSEDEGHGEPPSRRETVRREYAVIDENKVVEVNRRNVAYFTETDIYLVGYYQYSETYGECVPISEKWLYPEEYSEVRKQLENEFELDIP